MSIEEKITVELNAEQQSTLLLLLEEKLEHRKKALEKANMETSLVDVLLTEVCHLDYLRLLIKG